MSEGLGSFKDLYDVKLKARDPVIIDGTTYEEGEIILRFDSLQIATLGENKTVKAARGGFSNAKLVFWEDIPDINLQFTRGVFSKTQLAMAYNSKIWTAATNTNIPILQSETLEANEAGEIYLTQTPISDPFVYKVSDGSKITTYNLWDKKIYNLTPYTEYLVDYNYNYVSGAKIVDLAQPLYNGFFALEAKTSVKDDDTGQVVTALLKIPKVRLLSNVSLTLGDNASPAVASFNALGLAEGGRHQPYIAEMYFLNSDLSSDL